MPIRVKDAFLSAPVLFTGTLFCIFFARILVINEGVFVYCLDDAYIHLALASNIATGHYGLNPAEAAAPSSSILWPFLLAPFCRLGLEQYAPIAVNFVSTLATVAVARTVIGAVVDKGSARNRTVANGLTIVFVLATNTVGLAFTGMEHSLQLFFSILAVAGLIALLETGSVRWWLLAALVLGPLVRYENLALTAPAILLLFSQGHVKHAALTMLAVAATMAGFSLYLVSLGLGFVPTSILVKSGLFSDGVASVLVNLLHNLTISEGTVFSSFVLLSVYKAFFGRNMKQRTLAMWAAQVGVLHLLAGHFGWCSRYEIYAWAAILLCTVHLFGDGIHKAFNQSYRLKTWALPILGMMLLCAVYLKTTFTIANASNDIYSQQYQMRRFVKEYYRAPVAVNDIGWMSYRNEHYVLDLWGLASKTAFYHRKKDNGPEWIDKLAAEKGVELAMIYDHWITQMPSGWMLIAKLELSGNIQVVGETVSFWVRNSADRDRIIVQLKQFRRTLPKRSRIEIENES